MISGTTYIYHFIFNLKQVLPTYTILYLTLEVPDEYCPVT
jgi:hypothetical protein